MTTWANDNGDEKNQTEWNNLMTMAMATKMQCIEKNAIGPGCIHIHTFVLSFIHSFRKIKYATTGLDVPRDNGLKLFLEKEDMERLYDFEEECVEGYFRESEIALHQSTEERIKTTNERVENMSQKVEDINQKENLQSATVQVIVYECKCECLRVCK